MESLKKVPPTKRPSSRGPRVARSVSLNFVEELKNAPCDSSNHTSVTKPKALANGHSPPSIFMLIAMEGDGGATSTEWRLEGGGSDGRHNPGESSAQVVEVARTIKLHRERRSSDGEQAAQSHGTDALPARPCRRNAT